MNFVIKLIINLVNMKISQIRSLLFAYSSTVVILYKYTLLPPSSAVPHLESVIDTASDECLCAACQVE